MASALRPTLDSLPTDILYIILGYLNTAQSVAHLATSCKALHQVISSRGWRIFVTTRFSSLTLPSNRSDIDWADLAHTLTAQSRDWDRRVFLVTLLSPPQGGQRHNAPRGPGIQTIPSNVIVDAHLRRRGHLDEELVVLGAGEHVFARIRRKDRAAVVSESWRCHSGSEAGFVSGKDDTTAISITTADANGDLGVVVGRANGDLRLLSAGESTFGHTLMQFHPPPDFSVRQREIQAIDVERDSGVMAAGTRDSVLLYPIHSHGELGDDVLDSSASHSHPTAAISLREAPGSSPFEFVRSVRKLNKDTIALALNRSFDPIRILHVTPSGFKVSKLAGSAEIYPNTGLTAENRRTVRALLPVDMRSIVGGAGNALLSSWDDGTIRLQDLRTPSAVGRIYQDNLDVSVPINALVSYGLERFVAGSAHAPVLKIFDFRWTRGYYHTDSLPCSDSTPYPTPRSPTIVDEPGYSDNQLPCNHVMGRFCRWHSLSRHDYYRPNCNIFIPSNDAQASPVYSMAKPSDVSSTLYVGISWSLVEFTLKSSMTGPPRLSNRPPYARQRVGMAMVETGDGSAISDFGKCVRVPEIRRQSIYGHDRHDRHDSTIVTRQNRLDEALQ
ncbi:hypothetical protein GGR50DRAFT_664460 [Xylaria sp. CBS 124048]|nr:hypothetical protein GGR50DRAFT_664460 [Xylaria sp. CBS 124048]